MYAPVTRSIFDKGQSLWDRMKGRRKALDLAKVEAGQTDLGNYRVRLMEQVWIMGEVLLQSAVNKADDRWGLLDRNKPQTAC